MIKPITAFIAITFLLGCQSQEEKDRKHLDSLNSAIRVRELTDSFMEASQKKTYESFLASVDVCPVKITVKIYTEEYGKRGFKVTLKNTTNKSIDGIKFGILCYNNFNELVKDGIANAPIVGGDYQETIEGNSSATQVFTSYYFKSATKGKGFVSKIHFTDGSVWDEAKISGHQ